MIGFTVTDRGQALGFDLVFLSRNPDDHHQIVLATGKPANIPPNTVNPHRRCSRLRARQGPVHRRRHSHLEIELLTLRIRMIMCSIAKAQEIGLDWWKYDRYLFPITPRQQRRR